MFSFFVGLWIGLPGCVEEFDELAKAFFKATGDERKAIFDKVEKLLPLLMTKRSYQLMCMLKPCKKSLRRAMHLLLLS